MKLGDTIAAQATPPGRGGVGIIRVSGPETFFIAEKITGKKLKKREATFCEFFSADKKVIDKGIAIYFSSPNSFTGEDVLELQGHGGQVVTDLLLEKVLDLGARLARPGEFTQRAFLNKKIDLTQAEAVADLIDASTSQAAKNAMNSLQGKFSKKVNNIVLSLIDIRTKIEASIDFTEEEEVDVLQTEQTKKEIKTLLQEIKELKKAAGQGLIIQEGIKVIIVGKPNAGKSSLLNYLSGEDRAIVTDIPGTTRDLLREKIRVDGLKINLIDTAGLHDKPDAIEKEGIRRAKEEMKKADHVLVVVDSFAEGVIASEAIQKANNKKGNALELQFFLDKALCGFSQEIPRDVRLTILFNKIDLTGEKARIESVDGVDVLYFSVKTGEGVDLLKEHLKASAGLQTAEQGFSARRRHLNALQDAEKCLENVVGNNEELISVDLKEAQDSLGRITGRVTTEDLLDKIFSSFCIGK